MRISESQPLPPGWVERYDEEGNVWFDIRDDQSSEPLTESPTPTSLTTTQSPMASMSFAQRLYASALPAGDNASQQSHPQPHRASTYQTPSVPPPVPDNYRHHQRATTYSSSFAATNSARTSENLTSAPRSTPTVALVARAPTSGQVSPNGQHSFSATNPRSPSHETPMPLGTIPRHSNASVTSPPPTPRYQTQANPPNQQPTSARRYSTGPVSPPPSHPSTASGRYAGGPPPPPPSTTSSRPVHSPPMRPPPPQRTPTMPPPPPPRPPVMQHSAPPPPPPPPIQQQQTQRPLPTPYQNSSTQPNDRGLMADVGKAVGSMALKSVGGAMLGALTGGLLSSDVVDGLSTIFSGMGIGGDTTMSIPTNFGFDFSQLQAVAQGQPGADYQSVIDSILQTQQQQQPQQQSSGIDYQAIISELLKIQKQSTHTPAPYQPPVYHHPPPAPAPDFTAMYNQSYQNGMQQTMQIMENAMKPNPYLQHQMQGQSQQTIQMLQYMEQQQLQAQQNLLDMMKAQNAGAGYGAGENQSYYGGDQPSFGGGNGHGAYGHGHPPFAPGHAGGGHQQHHPPHAHGYGNHPQYGHHHSYTR